MSLRKGEETALGLKELSFEQNKMLKFKKENNRDIPHLTTDFWTEGDFTLDDKIDDTEEETQLEKEVDRMLYNDDELAGTLGFGDNFEHMHLREQEDYEQLMGEMMENAANQDHVADQIFNGVSMTSPAAEWFPWESKTMFILNVLDTMPRMRISDNLMKMIIWAFRECGVTNTPSFYALRKAQTDLRKSQGVPSIECKSVQGKVFYINDPRTIIAHDWANPSIRKHIHVYPEIPADGIIREVWHAGKWRKDLDLDVLSPMCDSENGSHYYVFELTRLCDGTFVIPLRWVVSKGTVHADAFVVTVSDGVGHIDNSKAILISTQDLNGNYLDLQHENLLPKSWTDSSMQTGYVGRMPNQYRQIAGGDPLYTSFIDFFGDDVSGNRSKSWNKHNNSYITHRNLPRKLLQQEFHIHLISTSQHATIPEQYADIKKVIEETHENPVRVIDENGLATRFMIQAHADPSDNPAQSEVASHIGVKGNHPCRKCGAGGSELEKSTDDGFHAMFLPGIARNRNDMKSELEAQVKLSCRGIVSHIEQRQTGTGTKDAYTQYWIDEIINRYKAMRTLDPSLTRNEIQAKLLEWVAANSEKFYSAFLTTKGFDPAKDTPVEILHTILLGVLKYIWYYSHSKWKPAQKQLYTHRLQATNIQGLSINPIRAEYIMNYANSLVGRQLKTIIQTALFHVYDLVDETHFLAWKAIGSLAALLWHIEIEDMDQYCNDVAIAAANVQDAFALIDPTKIIRKVKIHLLAHLPEDIRAFGPLLGVITESFESYNAVFRFCSVLSNHLAPSRDIARQTADQESMKNRLTGGRWQNTQSGEWMSAGKALQGFMNTQPVLQAMLGWSDHRTPQSGSVVKLPVGKPNAGTREIQLIETNAKLAINKNQFNLTSTWIKCKSVIAASSDACGIGAWVFFRSPINEKTLIGRINNILTNEKENIVILEEFEVSSARDIFFDLPYLYRRQGEVSFIIAPSANISFIQNVQHDCRTGKCAATGTRNRKQERQESGVIENFIEHTSDDRFLINLNAFHNAHLVRQVLPCELTKPIPIFADRRSEHNKIAQDLRRNLGKQKEDTTKKWQETQEKKRKALEASDEEPEGVEEEKGTVARKKITKRARRQT
ncbi:hypothetical protein K435DRAFT_807007 [Dendrothele bispora CBS 962.96]|uniref:Uncharacterized protein n=1 Tax=Dendrothele bispora (strain CBS 962.96) TaxID=1314807 RepID=A0A4S8L6F7_DENBC|nr:hypothetical protein K435DRAFT_807007 [Dendrothele bispora CBS 962.96]